MESGSREARILQIKFFEKVFNSYVMMDRYVFKNIAQGADADRIMIGHNFVIFAVKLCGNTHMRAFLTSHHVAETFEGFD